VLRRIHQWRRHTAPFTTSYGAKFTPAMRSNSRSASRIGWRTQASVSPLESAGSWMLTHKP
jgi:anti-sigma-K factor RskA